MLDNKDKYLSIRRSLFDHWLWDKKPFGKGQAWIDLIRRANIKYKKFPVNGEMVHLKRGDILTSVVKLSKSWGWSETTTRRFLYTLRNDKMIVLKAENRFTIITLINYKELGDASKLFLETKRRPNGDQTETINKSINNNDDKRSSSHNTLVLYKGQKSDDDYFFIRFKEITGHDVYPKELNLMPEIFKNKKTDIERAFIIMQKNRGSSIRYLLKVLETIKNGPGQKPSLDKSKLAYHNGCPNPEPGTKTGAVYKILKSNKFYCESCGKTWPDITSFLSEKEEWFSKNKVPAGV